MYQEIFLVGHLGGDPELRYTPKGVPVGSFSIAVNNRWSSGDDKESETLWFKITVWREIAESCAQYLVKGRLVLVVGVVEKPSPYRARDGELAASLEVTARVVKFLSRSQAEAIAQATTESAPDPTNQAVPEKEPDIPF